MTELALAFRLPSPLPFQKGSPVALVLKKTVAKKSPAKKTVRKKKSPAKKPGPKRGNGGRRREVGQTWGLGVGETWIRVFEEQPTEKKTDAEIAEFMIREFPDARAAYFLNVVGVRNRYNTGRLTNTGEDGQSEPPNAPVARYTDDGTEVPRYGRYKDDIPPERAKLFAEYRAKLAEDGVF